MKSAYSPSSLALTWCSATAWSDQRRNVGPCASKDLILFRLILCFRNIGGAGKSRISMVSVPFYMDGSYRGEVD